ncbi:MAG: sulfatase [Nanoarchaeota archaeon]|nr:sulfatase [Nanoarchaeota archaeon]
MEKIAKVWVSVFSFLSLITIIENFLHYKDLNNVLFILLALASNFALAILIISLNNLIFKKTRNKYYTIALNTIFFIMISWYVASTFIRFFFGNFASFSGLGFYWMSTSLWSLSLIFFIVLLISATLSTFMSRKIEPRKERSLDKLAVTVLFYVFIMLIIPNFYLQHATPFTNILGSNPLKIDVVPVYQTNSSTEALLKEITYSGKNPNIVIVMLESLSPDHIHYYGYEKNITPNLDWFFDNGIAFENAYSSATHTEYSQTSFLSSRYPLKSRIRDTFNEDYPRDFIWDILKNNNYTTGYITSQDDRWLNLESYWKKENLDFYWSGFMDKKASEVKGVFGLRNDDSRTLEIAESFINSSEKPFFLYMNLQSTHYPYVYPEEYAIFQPDELSPLTFYTYVPKKDNQVILNRYDNSIYYMDAQIGKLKKGLEDKGILNNTIVVIIADHGEMIEEQHGDRFHGLNIYEGNIKVPLVIFVPGEKPSLIKNRVKSIDVVPTILEIIKFQSSEIFQGETMKKDSEIFIMAQSQNFIMGIIKDDIKYIINVNNDKPDEAYNLTADPEELNNILENGNYSQFFPYRQRILSWYACQINYYQNEGYKSNSSIKC